ncbi:MAG: HlyC/CorC family transporter [Aquificae bacterium]|nr:HlyC/CorC family transporter [Aquificota bacterium]
MSEQTITFLIILCALLFLSAFFAGIESSFFSMDWLKIKRLASKGNKAAKLADKLRSKPKELVITFLIGNELVNITASAITTSYVIEHFGQEYLFLAVIVMTALILTFGEITPKTIGAYYSEKYALSTAVPFYVFYVAVTPFRFIFLKLSEAILKKFGIELATESHKLSIEDIKSIILSGVEKNIYTEEEQQIIEATLELHETVVSEIMTPRRDIFAIKKGLTIRQVVELLRGKEYSRIPVYEDTLDNIVGILYVKDIIYLIHEGKEEKIDRFLRKPYFIPEFTTLLTLLEEFQRKEVHIAIVVDEHGTVVGLVTLQDILEFVVGDIPQGVEEEEPYIKQISENEWEISGRLDVEILKEELGVPLPEDYDYDTVAGFILDTLNRFPEEGEEFVYKNFLFKILKVEKNRIISVLVKRLPEEEKKEEE